MYHPNPKSGNVLLGRKQNACQRSVFTIHNRFPNYMTLTPFRTQSIHKKGRPCYFTFVNSATLWDRGLYHYTHRPENERNPELCPRFISHMAPSPQQQHHVGIVSIKSNGPSNVRNRPDKLVPNTKSRWNSVYTSERQSYASRANLPRGTLPNVSKQPVPSEASSDEEPDTTRDDIQCAVSLGDGTIHAATNTEECNNSTLLITVPEIIRCSKAEETEIHFSFVTTEHDQHQEVIPHDEDASRCTTLKSPDLSDRASSCSSIYKSFSASFSHLHSSLSSLSSKSVEIFNNSSSIAFTSNDRKSPQAASGCGSSVLGPGLHSKSCCGNADIYQTSSYSVRKYSQASDFSPIDKMWHDHFLSHWPVLPPISPQRAFSESSKTVGQSSVPEFTDNDQDAFDELEMLAPHTGSSQSLENAHSESCADCSSDSDICKSFASLTIGFSDSEKSLADLRLSLLDHTYHEPDKYLAENCSTWDGNVVMDSQRQKKEFLAFSTKGSLHSSTPGLQKAANTTEKYLYTKEDDQQHTTTMYTDLEENHHSIREYLHHSHKAPTDCSHTMDSSNCSDSCLTRITKGSKPRDGEYEDKDDIFSDRGQTEASRPQFLRRRKPAVLDLSIRQEMERQRIAEERRAQALHMYSKLRNTRPTMVRTTQSMSISRFEDFDFLAKYCIFSQEKLAEYKRAFEAVDTDEDGYLDCLQVLMALKEIVPANALSDAEELYVYRILEIVDYYVTDGLTDLRLFAVMASLAQKIAALDSFMRSLIDHMDFKALELKMYKAKQLFLCNIDAETKSISVEQLLVELKAGGISREHEEAAQLQLSNIKKLDILDFLTYLPLFVLIHNSVISNPLDDSRKI
ncbi:uncharacterized protein [Pyxicephalus adspersus]|uniref:uncharacterized protein n=1 Tax=Pyxicephalus adspersus TaxID=30357 RepID=UPI003B5945D7